MTARNAGGESTPDSVPLAEAVVDLLVQNRCGLWDLECSPRFATVVLTGGLGAPPGGSTGHGWSSSRTSSRTWSTCCCASSSSIPSGPRCGIARSSSPLACSGTRSEPALFQTGPWPARAS